MSDLAAENERLRLAILDIDAHATPMGVLHEDDPEGSPAYYQLTVGALHRALGIVGHTAPKRITPHDPELIAALYALVPENAGLPIGAAALIWRAARELEALWAFKGASAFDSAAITGEPARVFAESETP